MPKQTRAETELYLNKLKVNINGLVYAKKYREAFYLLIQASKVLEWDDYRNVLKYLDERCEMSHK